MNVAGLLDDMLRNEYVKEVSSLQLPYNTSDLMKVNLHDAEVLLLCHSVVNRGFTITDVTGALYDEFLKKASCELGMIDNDILCVCFTDK